METARGIRKEIVTFLVITFGLSLVFYGLVISAGILAAAGSLTVLGLMWCPGIAALVTCLVYHRNVRGLGWGWGKTRYHALSFALPIVYSLVAYGMVWLSGLGRISERFFRIPWWGLAALIGFGTLGSCLAALGEEIGWRGLLVPRLAKLTSFTNTALISGVIWALWHYPLILFADYHTGGIPVWYSLLCFTVMVIGISFAFSWLRLKSGSLWTAMFIHANHNLYIQRLFDPYTVDTGITRFIIGEFGAALAIISVIVALVFWRMRSRLPTPRSAAGLGSV